MRYSFNLIFIFIVCIFLQNIVFAETKTNNQWNNKDTNVFNKGFENQKAVSDNKLKKTIEQIKERSLTKKQRQLKENFKPLSPNYDEEHFKNFVQDNNLDSKSQAAHTVMIPMNVYTETGDVIPSGYYKLSCKKQSENKYSLELSQGTKLIAEIPAIQTKQDLEQESINFCNAEIIENNRLRLMYGNIDLNLIAYLYYD